MSSELAYQDRIDPLVQDALKLMDDPDLIRHVSRTLATGNC